MRHPEYKIFNLIYLMFLNNKKKNYKKNDLRHSSKGFLGTLKVMEF